MLPVNGVDSVPANPSLLNYSKPLVIDRPAVLFPLWQQHRREVWQFIRLVAHGKIFTPADLQTQELARQVRLWSSLQVRSILSQSQKWCYNPHGVLSPSCHKITMSALMVCLRLVQLLGDHFLESLKPVLTACLCSVRSLTASNRYSTSSSRFGLPRVCDRCLLLKTPDLQPW